MENSNTTTAELPALENLKREFFASTEADKAQAAVQQAREICAAHNLPVAFTWPAENGEPLPENYGIGIIPVQRRIDGRGNVVIGCYIAGLPEIDAILTHPKGEAFVRDTIASACMAKIANAVRPRDGQDGPVSAPFSVAEFIERADRDTGLSWFRANAPAIVKYLNDKFRRKVMTPNLLRQVLASASFAEQQFPTIVQAKWEGLLAIMVKNADAKGEDVGVVRHWQETRDQTEINIASDWDVSDFDDMLADSDTAS